MATWDMGYHSELLYTTGYYREISPVYINYLLATQGYDMPELNGNFRACELGFGQGVSITMHSSATPIYWAGNDFNPTQVNFAQELASKANLSSDKVLLTDDAFNEFAERSDIGEFDFICLHGIWSWISPENQQIIIDFVRDHLKIGGVLYISYNVGPGFTAFEPVRHLMKAYDTNFNTANTDPRVKFQNIGEFLKALLSVNPRYAAVVNNLQSRVDGLLQKDYHYINGEYLNEHWDIRHFDSMAKDLERAKLSFACSATMSELIDSITLSAEQQAFLAPYRGTTYGEVIRDFIVNQQFRRDLFIKGARRMSPQARSNKLNNIYVCLNMPANEISYTFSTALGKAELRRETYEPIYKVLEDHKVHSIGEIKDKVKGKVTSEQVEEGIMILVSQGYIAPCLDPKLITKESKAQCLSLNKHILSPEINANIEFLCSPVVGGGVYMTALSKALLNMKLEQPKITNKEMLDTLVENITSSNRALNLKGQEIKDPKEIRKALSEHIENFSKYYMDFYKKLGTIE